MMTQKISVDTLQFIPVEQYLENRLSKKFQKKLNNHNEKAFGHDIYEFNKNKYLTIFSNERFETIPIIYVNGIDGIRSVRHKYTNADRMAFIDIVSSYTIVEDAPKGIILSSISVPFYNKNFMIKDVKNVIINSGINIRPNSITSERITLDGSNVTPFFGEISFKAGNISINVNFDAENKLATVWTKIINYTQMLESNIDPFKDSNADAPTNPKVMEMLPIDYSILQLENVSRVAGILRRHGQI